MRLILNKSAKNTKSLIHILKRFGETPVITNHDAERGHPQLADGLMQCCQD